MTSLVRGILTPARQRFALASVFFASLLSGAVSPWVLMYRSAAPVLPPPEARPLPALTPLPDITPEPPLLKLDRPLRSLGAAAATPRRSQFKNTVTMNGGSKTITLPPHEGEVDAIVGPLTLQVLDGEILEWNPAEDLSGTLTEVHWVYAQSDVDGVEIWGTGNDVPEPTDIRMLSPAMYVPETMSLPFHIRNNTGRAAVVTIRVGMNIESSPPSPIDL